MGDLKHGSFNLSKKLFNFSKNTEAEFTSRLESAMFKASDMYCACGDSWRGCMPSHLNFSVLSNLGDQPISGE